MLTGDIINRVGHCLHEQSTNKLQNSAKTHQTLQQPHPPGVQPGYPKYIPDDSPVSVQQNETQLDTNPSQFEEDTEL